MPATLVDATFHAIADAGSIPAVSTFRTALRISGGRFFYEGEGIEGRDGAVGAAAMQGRRARGEWG